MFGIAYLKANPFFLGGVGVDILLMSTDMSLDVRLSI